MPCPWAYNQFRLKLQLDPPLQLPWCTGSVHAGAGPDPQRVSGRKIPHGRSVHGAGRPVQESAEVIGNAIEVGEIEEIENSEGRLDGNPLFDVDRPGDLGVEAARPTHIHLIRWSQRQAVRNRTQLRELRTSEQAGVDQSLSRRQQLSGVVVVVLRDELVDVARPNAASEGAYLRSGQNVLVRRAIS